MYIGDIKLDANGNSVVQNGELTTTTTNMDFIIRSLKYGPSSFKLHPEIGFGLDRYIGELNNESTHRTMIREIKEYFLNHGITTEVNLLPVDNNTVAGEIIVPAENIRVLFVFNMQSGLTALDQDVTEEADTTESTQESTNKYLNRRI